MLSSTAQPTDPILRGSPGSSGWGGSSKLAPPRSLPAPAPVCSSARRCPWHGTSPETSSSWKGGEAPATPAPHHGPAQPGVPVPPPSPFQPEMLPGPQLHSQEGQGGHADDGHEQPGQDGEGQEVGESCGQRGARADPRQHRGCRLGETGGGSGSPAGGDGGVAPPWPFSPWPWCRVSVRGTPPSQALGCPMRGEGHPREVAVTAGCKRGTPLGTTARSPGLGTASRWVKDTRRGVTGRHGTRLGPHWDHAGTLAAPGCPCPRHRWAGWHISVCHPRAGRCPVPCQHPGPGREQAGQGGATRHSDKQQHPVLPFVEPKPIPPHFFDHSAAFNSMFCVCGLF